MNTLPPVPCLNANYTNLNGLLQNYFNCGFAYREIIEFLKIYHNKNIRLSTMKRKFKKIGLSWRSIITQRTPDVKAEAAVYDETAGRGSNVGYRRVWVSLWKEGVIAGTEDVRLLLILDPERVERKDYRKFWPRIYRTLGPNYRWIW